MAHWKKLCRKKRCAWRCMTKRGKFAKASSCKRKKK